MIVTKKALPRRTFLRGAGVTLALPLLDAMIPSFTARAATAVPVRRLGFVYIPMGCNWYQWFPKDVGNITSLSPTLSTLTPVLDQVTVISNLELKNSPFRRDFVPGFLLVPETDVLFVGAGTRVLIYDLKEPKRLLTDEVVGGFWGWEQHRNMVFMLSEVELSAFDLRGARLWPTFVDPPWVYEVTESTVVIEDFSGVRELDLRSGMPIG